MQIKTLVKSWLACGALIFMGHGVAQAAIFDTEMLAMELQAPGVLIRESPTKQSLGKTMIRESPTRIDSFFDVFTELSTDGGQTWTPSPTPSHMRFGGDLDADGVTFDTEMLQLDILAPGGIMLRESPTLPSKGKTTVRESPTHTFAIDSFFDVFVELSIDGGQTWSPAPPPPVSLRTRSVSVPETGSTLGLLIGACGALLGSNILRRKATA
jgi:hypothetical protein